MKDEEKKIMQKDNEENLTGGGKRLRQLRLNHGMTQRDVAAKLHVTSGYISNIESGRVEMSLKYLRNYATLLNMTVDELIGEIHPEYKGKAINNQLWQEINQMSLDDQERLLKTIRLWKKSRTRQSSG